MGAFAVVFEGCSDCCDPCAPIREHDLEAVVSDVTVGTECMPDGSGNSISWSNLTGINGTHELPESGGAWALTGEGTVDWDFFLGSVICDGTPTDSGTVDVDWSITCDAGDLTLQILTQGFVVGAVSVAPAQIFLGTGALDTPIANENTSPSSNPGNDGSATISYA